MLDARRHELAAQKLGFFNGARADQHGPPQLLKALYFLGHRLELRVLGGEDTVGPNVANARHVRRHADDPELVDASQLHPVLRSRAAHARQLLVEPKIRLEGHLGRMIRRQGDLHFFLGFDGLMQAFTPVPVGHAAAGRFIDDDHLVVLDHVMLIAAKTVVRLHGALNVLVQLVHGMGVRSDRWVGVPDQLAAHVGQLDLLFLLIEIVVLVWHHLQGKGVRPVINDLLRLGRRPGRHRDDEGRARFVHEDIVRFVHQGEMVLALDLRVLRLIERTGRSPRRPKRHHLIASGFLLETVAQEIEAEFRGGAVSDVRLVGVLAGLIGHFLLQDADADPKRAINLRCPLTVTMGQVVVYRGNVHTLAFERVQGGGQGCNERLAFTGGHFRKRSVVEHNARGQSAHRKGACAPYARPRRRLARRLRAT